MRGAYTPQVQEAVTRLGSRLSFKEAQEELEMMWGISISIGSVREITLRNGRLANELVEKEVERLQEEATKAQAKPKQLVMSADGAMVQLGNGEWREVKTVAIGEFETRWNAKKQEVETKTKQISYFSSADKADRFAEKAVIEWHRRGGENAGKVIAVNDGAAWIQSFIDYHCPQAIRVIDFAHAKAYVAKVGKSLYGAESQTFKQWFAKMSKQLGKKAPQRAINDLRLLWSQNQTHPEADEVENAIRYLERRQEMIDYPHFRKNGIPIGSGIVESANNVVMQRRMKQAGMRWADENLNPMLALRMAICNNRWAESWSEVHAHFLANKHHSTSSPSSPKPQTVSEADVDRLENLALKVEALSRNKQPWQDHRWIFPYRQPLLHKN